MIFFGLVGIGMFSSCSKSRSDSFEVIATSSPFDFHSIEVFESNIYATGGDVWMKSDLAKSSNGKEWIVDSLTNKSIFDLYSDDQFLYGVGNDGYIFSGDPKLELTRTKHWGLLRSFTSSGENFIAAGGKDFNKGWIYRVNSDLQIDTTHQYDHEILTTLCNKSGRCVAAGYGIILTSDDASISWQRSTENGDYYNSIALNSEDRFYIVGYEGTIIYSDNGGSNWEKIKNGHSPLKSNKPFRSIKFNGDKGVIVGDNGLVWHSPDGGEHWEDMSIDTGLDLFDFVFFGGKIFCASENGQIISLEI